jgi:hypothetical protein
MLALASTHAQYANTLNTQNLQDIAKHQLIFNFLPHTMPETYEEIEARIQKVLDTIPPDFTPNISRLAGENNLPYYRLLARYHGRPTRFERPSGTLKLSESQNYVLREFVRFLDQLGISARVAHVVRCANTILQADYEDPSLPPPTVTNRWARAWITRQDDIFVRRQRHLDLNRALAHDIDGIRKWFDGFIKIILDYGINPADIWNFDETGFRIGIGKDQWIITYEPNRRHFMAAPDNRETMTAIESVNAIGDVIAPMLVIKGSQFLARYFADLPDRYCTAMSDTGYSNDEICLDWVKHWEKESRTIQKGVWRLLLFDGFESHLSMEFLDVLESNKVIPYRLIPHSTHLLQPLDVGCFQPYKHWHSEAVDAATRTGCTSFNKVEFLAAIDSIRRQTFKRTTIRSGWHKTGLVPYNPEIVLRKLREMEINSFQAIPATPPRQSSNKNKNNNSPSRNLSPVKTYRQFCDHLRWLVRVEGEKITQNTRTVLRGAYQLALAGENAYIHMRTMTAAAQARQERQKRNRQVLPHQIGVIYADDARKMVRKREMEQREKEIKKWIRERGKLRTVHTKAYKPIHRQLELVWASMRAADCFSYEDN